MRAQRLDDLLGDRQRLREQDARRRAAVVAGLGQDAEQVLLDLLAEPAQPADLRPPRRPRAAPPASRSRARRRAARARLGPKPGRRITDAGRSGTSRAASPTAGMSPVSSSATSFSSSVLPMPGSSVTRPSRASCIDRDGGVAHRLGRRPVGDHAVLDGAVELVQVRRARRTRRRSRRWSRSSRGRTLRAAAELPTTGRDDPLRGARARPGMGRHPSHAARAGARGPGACSPSGSPAGSPSPCCCSRPRGSSRCIDDARPQRRARGRACRARCGAPTSAYVLERNGLVLALHALACVAGFMAGSSAADRRRRLQRAGSAVVHEKAGPAGDRLRARRDAVLASAPRPTCSAARPRRSPRSCTSRRRCCCCACTPHALPELTALFLPLAAWTLASRRGAWDELLAATIVTVAIAVPVLLAAGAIETWVTPHVIRAIAA